MEECFQLFSQAIMAACGKLQKNSFTGDDWSLFQKLLCTITVYIPAKSMIANLLD